MTLVLAQTAGATPDYWPFAVLGISVALIVLLITVLRVHAFMALILAAFAAGLLAKTLPGEPEKSHWVQAIELSTAEFSLMAGNRKPRFIQRFPNFFGHCLVYKQGRAMH